jgi:hypothetical protein
MPLNLHNEVIHVCASYSHDIENEQTAQAAVMLLVHCETISKL